MICKNCEQNFSGNFCYNCGQKSKVERINFNYIINEIPNSLFQLNRGIIYTIKELLIRPGHSIREFLSGKRIHHYKPIPFLLITTTIYVLSTYLLGNDTFIDEFINAFKLGRNDANKTISVKILDWISKHQAYVSLIILLLFSTSTYIAFSKSCYNYFEHLVINFYITGQQMLIYLIFGALHLHEDLIFLIGVIYNFWVFNQLFKNKKFIKKFGLILLSYFIFLIIVFIIWIIALGIPNY